ncbi:Nonsense-mediated mRNA decay protein 5 [Spathaspora sp. JA1]|nr:Nonsense-mediated mRNA decay protein 5 [Spathaspora sp. JA1]
MDPEIIITCIAGTLEPSPDVRTAAEQRLRELSHTPGFLGSCLDILINSSTPEGLKKATAVYFKNRVVRFWKDDKSPVGIDHDEKPIVLDRIVPVMVQSDYHIKQQLIPVLRVLITFEFEKWPQLLEIVAQLLQGQTKDEIYTGIICFSEIARKFKWVENSDRSHRLDNIIVQFFPHLLTMGNSLIESEGINEFSAEILKLILKVYKFVTYYDLPVPLQSRDSIIAWGEFHAHVINMNPPDYIHNSNLSEQEKSMLQISKCYKWAISNLYRLFSRYASKSLTRKFHYAEFHKLFLNEFMPHFISNFLIIIEQYCQGKRWLSISSLFKLLEFLSHCVGEKSTWLLIKPYYETLISHLVYPLLCPSDESLELFDEDPVEYIHLFFDPHYEYDSPDRAALALIATYVYKRKKTTLIPILTFIHQQLNSLKDQQETLEVAKKREGALRMLGAISVELVGAEESTQDQMEPFLSMFVVPCLGSKYGFLQARALEIMASFADVEFTDESTISTLYHGILKNFDESKQHEISLPVTFEASLTLQAFLIRDDFKQVLAGLILPTVSKLLELSNDIDSDAIPAVMQECVEHFSEQLQPFGVDLMTKLVSQFMRLAIEVNEASNVDVNEIDDGFEDQGEKVMAGLGFLNTMITVLLSFENSREVCIKLEEIFSEAISYVLVNESDDFFAEIGELMENSSFLTRSISPIMWQQFKLLYLSFDKGVALMYVEELIQCLQNFLIYGREELQRNQELSGMFFKIFALIVGCEDTAYNELVNAFELAQTFILVLEQQSKPYIPDIINRVLAKYPKQEEQEQEHSQRLLLTNCHNVIISALVYDTNTTMVLLQQSGQLFPFLNNWFTSIGKLVRVYDLKLTILGLLSLGGIELDNPTLLEISRNLIVSLKKLPIAIENLEAKRRNYNELSQQRQRQEEIDENGVYVGQIDLGTDADDEGEAEETAGEEDDTDKYIKFLNNEDIKLSGYFDEKNEDLYEDPLVSTPLDEMNIFTYVKQFIDSINGSARFNLMFGDLNEEDRQVIIKIMEV